MKSNIFLYGILGPISIIFGIYVFYQSKDDLIIFNELFFNDSDHWNRLVEAIDTHPKISGKNKIYYADQITSTNNKEMIKDAEKIDPDNARYNYILANTILEESVRQEGFTPIFGGWEKKKNKIEEKPKDPLLELKYEVPYTEKTESIQIEDLQKFEKGMDEFLKGTKKKYFSTYEQEIIDAKLKQIPSVRDASALISKTEIIFGNRANDIFRLHDITCALIAYAEYLIEKGEKDKALELLDGWIKMLQQDIKPNVQFFGFHTFIRIMLYGKTVAKLYEKEGKFEEARKIGSIAKEFYLLKNRTWPVDAKGKRELSEKEKQNYKMITNHAGMSEIIFLYPFGENLALTKEQLKPSREVDYIMLKRGMLIFMICLFLIYMLSSGISIMLGLLRGTDTAVLKQLYPSFTDSLKIISIGIILPLVLYIMTGQETHEYSLHVSLIKNLLESFFICCAVTILVVQLTKVSIYSKGVKASLIKPDILKSQNLRLRVAAVSTLCLISSMYFTKDMPLTYGIPTGIIIVLWISFSVIISFEYKANNERKAAVRLAKQSMMPGLIGALLFLILVCYPLLELREWNIVQQNKPKSFYPTEIEGDFIRSFNQEIKKIFEEAEKISK